MITRFSQLKQTISDEIQQAASARSADDPSSVIERNAKLLAAETPSVDSIVNDLGDPGNPETSTETSNSTNNKGGDSEKEPPSRTATGADTNIENKTNDETEPSNKMEQKTDPENVKKSSSREPTSRAASPAVIDSKVVSPAPSEDPELQSKLTKFAKYEEKYPQLLKAYKIEKKRNELVKMYEKILSEHTPCSTIAEPQALVDFIKELTSRSSIQQRELQKVEAELSSLTKQAEDLRKELRTTKTELNNTKSDLAKLQSELKNERQKAQDQAQAAVVSAQDSKREFELKARVESLESQLEAAEQARDSAVKSQSTLKTQLEELSTRFNENFAETDVLRDELHEAEKLAQGRLRELSTLRGQLHTQEKGRRKSADDTVSQLSELLVEKEQLEADVEMLNKRIIRESDQLNMQIKSLRIQLADSEAHEAELRRQLAQSQFILNEPRQSTSEKPTVSRRTGSRNLVSPSQQLAPDYSPELIEAREAVATANKANELLKQVNADNSLRIEKLLKSQRALALDLEQLRHENAVLRKQGRRGSVSTSQPASSSEGEELAEQQQAYLKNVLLGFIEHKGRRKALMPVLATLLGMKDSEVDLFMREFV